MAFDLTKNEKQNSRVRKRRILVTGGTGFLGRRIVKKLVQKGYQVRVLAKMHSNIDYLLDLGVEVFTGDIRDKGSYSKAFSGVEKIIHTAAGTSGNGVSDSASTILGTRNTVELSNIHGVKRLVYISSCGVYGTVDCKKYQLVTENSALERFPERRGSYSAAKREAEDIVLDAIKKDNVPAVVLRPGTIYGPEGNYITPMLGFHLIHRFLFVIGNGSAVLPLVFVDNVVDAIVVALENNLVNGEIFNVVDGGKISKKMYINAIVKPINPKSVILYIPFIAFYLITIIQEVIFKLVGEKPLFSRYRLISSQKKVYYDNAKLREMLGWYPRISFEEGVKDILEWEKNKIKK